MAVQSSPGSSVASSGSALPSNTRSAEAATSLPAAEPRLIDMVEPEVDRATLRRIRGQGEVVAVLRLQADGRVQQVELISSKPASLAGPVLVAMRQWRYEAGAADRKHGVKLVVNPDD